MSPFLIRKIDLATDRDVMPRRAPPRGRLSACTRVRGSVGRVPAHSGNTSAVEAIREIYTALAEGDVGPLVDLMDEDIEWHEPEGAPVVCGAFRGRATVLSEVLLRTAEVWERFRIEPEEFVHAGERVVVTGRQEVTARGTGGQASVPFAHVWELRDGRIVRWRCFTDTALLQAARTSR